jgi:hypothetical protein
VTTKLVERGQDSEDVTSVLVDGSCYPLRLSYLNDLPKYAEESIRRAARLEEAGEDLRKKIHATIRAHRRRHAGGPQSAQPSAGPR